MFAEEMNKEQMLSGTNTSTTNVMARNESEIYDRQIRLWGAESQVSAK